MYFELVPRHEGGRGTETEGGEGGSMHYLGLSSLGMRQNRPLPEFIVHKTNELLLGEFSESSFVIP